MHGTRFGVRICAKFSRFSLGHFEKWAFFFTPVELQSYIESNLSVRGRGGVESAF